MPPRSLGPSLDIPVSAVQYGLSMTLDEYLKTNGISGRDFAREVGSTEATISRLRRKMHMPKLDLVQRIIEHTRNTVSLQDLLTK
jgi:transcriptional regulator with XRE-family HTH domain